MTEAPRTPQTTKEKRDQRRYVPGMHQIQTLGMHQTDVREGKMRG